MSENRRSFLKKLGLAGLLAPFVPSVLKAKMKPKPKPPPFVLDGYDEWKDEQLKKAQGLATGDIVDRAHQTLVVSGSGLDYPYNKS